MTAQQTIRVPMAEMMQTAKKIAVELGGKTIQGKGLTSDGCPQVFVVAKGATSAAWGDQLAVVQGMRSPDAGC